VIKIKRYKNISLKELNYLKSILYRTKKKRIKKKICNRISDGTFNMFLNWIDDKNKKRKDGLIYLPTSEELIKRY